MTYKQAQDLGGYVRKGKRGSPAVYASTFKKEEETDDGDTEIKEISFLKTYTVFNVEQIEDLPGAGSGLGRRGALRLELPEGVRLAPADWRVHR